MAIRHKSQSAPGSKSRGSGVQSRRCSLLSPLPSGAVPLPYRTPFFGTFKTICNNMGRLVVITLVSSHVQLDGKKTTKKKTLWPPAEQACDTMFHVCVFPPHSQLIFSCPFPPSPAVMLTCL